MTPCWFAKCMCVNMSTSFLCLPITRSFPRSPIHRWSFISLGHWTFLSILTWGKSVILLSPPYFFDFKSYTSCNLTVAELRINCYLSHVESNMKNSLGNHFLSSLLFLRKTPHAKGCCVHFDDRPSLHSHGDFRRERTVTIYHVIGEETCVETRIPTVNISKLQLERDTVKTKIRQARIPQTAYHMGGILFHCEDHTDLISGYSWHTLVVYTGNNRISRFKQTL